MTDRFRGFIKSPDGLGGGAPGRGMQGANGERSLMGGAIMSHLTVLGIEVEGDGGLLFTMAVVSLVAGAITSWLHRTELPIVGARFAPVEA